MWLSVDGAFHGPCNSHIRSHNTKEWQHLHDKLLVTGCIYKVRAVQRDEQRQLKTAPNKTNGLCQLFGKKSYL